MPESISLGEAVQAPIQKGLTGEQPKQSVVQPEEKKLDPENNLYIDYNVDSYQLLMAESKKRGIVEDPEMKNRLDSLQQALADTASKEGAQAFNTMLHEAWKRINAVVPESPMVAQPEATVAQPEQEKVGTKISLEDAKKIVTQAVDLKSVPESFRHVVIDGLASQITFDYQSPYLRGELVDVFRDGLKYPDELAEQTADAILKAVEKQQAGDPETEDELVQAVKADILKAVKEISAETEEKKLTEYQVLQKLEEFRVKLEGPDRLDLKNLAKLNRTLSNRYRGVINYHLNRKINTILRAVEQSKLSVAAAATGEVTVDPIVTAPAAPAEGEKTKYDWSAFDKKIDEVDEILLEPPQGAVPQSPVDIEPTAQLEPDAAAAGDPIEGMDEDEDNEAAPVPPPAPPITPPGGGVPPTAPPDDEIPPVTPPPEPPKTPEKDKELSPEVRIQLRQLLRSKEFVSVFKNIGIGATDPEINAFITTYFAEGLVNATKENAAEMRVQVLERLHQGGQIQTENTKSNVFFAQLNELMDRVFGDDSGKHDVIITDGSSYKRINEKDPGFKEAMDGVPKFKTRFGRLFGRARAFFGGRYLPEKYLTTWEDSVAAGRYSDEAGQRRAENSRFDLLPAKDKDETLTPEQQKSRLKRKVARWLARAMLVAGLVLGTGATVGYVASRYSSENGSSTQRTENVVPNTDENSDESSAGDTSGAGDTAANTVETTNAALTPLDRLNAFCVNHVETFAALGEADSQTFYKAGEDSYILEVIEDGEGTVCKEIPKQLLVDAFGEEVVNTIAAYAPQSERPQSVAAPDVLSEANSASADLVSQIYDQIKFGDVTRARLITPEEAANMEPIVKEEDGTFTLKFSDGSSGKMLTYKVFGVTAEQLEGLVDFDGIPNARASSETKVEVSIVEDDAQPKPPEKEMQRELEKVTIDGADLWEYGSKLLNWEYPTVDNIASQENFDTISTTLQKDDHILIKGVVQKDADSELLDKGAFAEATANDGLKDLTLIVNFMKDPDFDSDGMGGMVATQIPEGASLEEALAIDGPVIFSDIAYKRAVDYLLTALATPSDQKSDLQHWLTDFVTGLKAYGAPENKAKAAKAMSQDNRPQYEKWFAVATGQKPVTESETTPPEQPNRDDATTEEQMVNPTVATPLTVEPVTVEVDQRSMSTPTPNRPAESQAAPATPESVAENVVSDALAEQLGPEAARILEDLKKNEGQDVANLVLAFSQGDSSKIKEMDSGSAMAQFFDQALDSTEEQIADGGEISTFRVLLTTAAKTAETDQKYGEDDPYEVVSKIVNRGYDTVNAAIGAIGRAFSAENQVFAKEHLGFLLRQTNYPEIRQTLAEMSEEDGRDTWLGFESQADFTTWLTAFGDAIEAGDRELAQKILAESPIPAALSDVK